MHPSLNTKIHYFLAVGEAQGCPKTRYRAASAKPEHPATRTTPQLRSLRAFDTARRADRSRRSALPRRTDALQQLDRAFTRAGQVAQGLRGALRAGYSTFAATGPMSDIIIEFRKQYPDAHVALWLLASSEKATAFEEALDLGFMMSKVSSLPLMAAPFPVSG